MTENELMKSIGDKLRTVRKYRDVSQDKLAHITHISRTYIANIEKGKRSPSIDVLMRMADALNCDLLINLKLRDKI